MHFDRLKLLSHKKANKILTTGQDGIDNTLSFNLGIGEFRGIFLVQLHRGSNLPCSNNVTLNTVVDYQEQIVIEIYQGERPLSRYCNLLGTLLVNDLPIDKAYKVEISVNLTIDRNEVLTLSATELKRNKNLSVVIEKPKIKTENGMNMVLDAFQNKAEDDALVQLLDEINDIIEITRVKYENTEKESFIFDKMNSFVDKITANNKKSTFSEIKDCKDEILKFVEEQKKKHK